MDITILGTRGEIPASSPYHARHSGVLIDSGLMLDVGEKEFLNRRAETILITHLHPDHAFFVRDPEETDIDIPMYAPEAWQKSGIRVKRFEGSGRFAGYDIQTVPTIHSLKVKSHGFIIESGGARIFYSGDLIWITKKYQSRLGKLDLVITEGSFIRQGGMVRRDRESGRIYGHAGIRRLVRMFKEYTDRIVLVHFGSWLYKDIREARKRIRKMSREEKVDLQIGYDGMKLKV